MTEQNALSIQHESQAVVMFDDDKIELIKRTIAKGATNDELDLFLNQCRRTQLDPFLRQIYMRKQWDSKEGREVASTGITIDGFRIIAERSNKYAGQLGPYWCDTDGMWVDVWLKSTPPAAAKVAVLRTDFKEPLWAVAKYSEYVQTKKDGQPNSMWVKMPASQLAKCAESLAHRKAFPHDLSGLYTVEEMGQAENVIEGSYTPAPVTQAPQRQTAPKLTPVIQLEEVQLSARDDHEMHITPAQKPAAKQAAGQKPTIAMLNKLHAIGTQKFGPEWDDARHELIGKLTDGRTNSSKDLTYEECVKMAETIKSFADYEDADLFDVSGSEEN